MSTPWSGDTLTELAELELFQGLQSPADAPSTRRRELYELFGSPDEPWATRAQLAYAAMSRSAGFVASVGDQLAAEVDILSNADTYAAIGGFDVAEITTGLGSWWSPSAAWFRYGREFLASSGRQDTASDTEDEPAQLLLRAGALSLARFYEGVADGAVRLTASLRWRPGKRMRRREIAFMAGVLLFRRDRFLEGSREDGRYLDGDGVSQRQIIEAARSRRPPRSRRGREVAGSDAA